MVMVVVARVGWDVLPTTLAPAHVAAAVVVVTSSDEVSSNWFSLVALRPDQ